MQMDWALLFETTEHVVTYPIRETLAVIPVAGDVVRFAAIVEDMQDLPDNHPIRFLKFCYEPHVVELKGTVLRRELAWSDYQEHWEFFVKIHAFEEGV